MNEKNADPSKSAAKPAAGEITRRNFFEKLSITLGGVCATLLGLPLVGFVLAPLLRKAPGKWVPVGKMEEFQIGKTIDVVIDDHRPCHGQALRRGARPGFGGTALIVLPRFR